VHVLAGAFMGYKAPPGVERPEWPPQPPKGGGTSARPRQIQQDAPPVEEIMAMLGLKRQG